MTQYQSQNIENIIQQERQQLEKLYEDQNLIELILDDKRRQLLPIDEQERLEEEQERKEEERYQLRQLIKEAIIDALRELDLVDILRNM